MFEHSSPIDLTDYLQTGDVVDNLLTRVADKPLSANQGVVLREMIEAKATPVSMSVVGSNVELLLDDGSKVIMDATRLLMDIKSISGRYDEPTHSLVISLSDSSSFSIPVANLLPVTTDETIDGDGSATPLSVAISAVPDNTLTRGTDGKLYVPKEVPSDEPDNGITLVDSRFYLGVLNEDDLHSASITRVPTQRSVKRYVDNKFPDNLFIQSTGFVVADPDKPTVDEVRAKIQNFRRGVVYYNKTDNAATMPTHTWYVDTDGNIVPLGSQQDAPVQVATSDLLIGQLFYDTDNTPAEGKLFQGSTYSWASNPKLKAKFDAKGHDFITDNGDGTFTVASHTDFLRAGVTNIGKHVEDTTAVNGLHINNGGRHSHVIKQSYTSIGTGKAYESGKNENGSFHTEPDGVHAHSMTGDSETAPTHRVAYFGIYGDAVVITMTASDDYTVVNHPSDSDKEVPTTHAVKQAIYTASFKGDDYLHINFDPSSSTEVLTFRPSEEGTYLLQVSTEGLANGNNRWFEAEYVIKNKGTGNTLKTTSKGGAFLRNKNERKLHAPIYSILTLQKGVEYAVYFSLVQGKVDNKCRGSIVVSYIRGGYVS